MKLVVRLGSNQLGADFAAVYVQPQLFALLNLMRIQAAADCVKAVRSRLTSTVYL